MLRHIHLLFSPYNFADTYIAAWLDSGYLSIPVNQLSYLQYDCTCDAKKVQIYHAI